MEQIDIDLKGHKLTKTLPKQWITSDIDQPKGRELFVLEDFEVYLNKLHASLLGIKKYYEKEFNKDSSYAIDDLIALYNNAYNKIVNYLIPGSPFLNMDKIKIDSEKFVFNKGRVCGFTDKFYDRINYYAKLMFMIEKICSFTTRKFWQKEMTKFEDLDLNKNYKILVKCVFPYAWRGCDMSKSQKIDQYMKSRVFHSTSIIDENHFYNLFCTNINSKYALLIIDYDDEKFVCASPTDSYSEEVIDRKNLIKDKYIFSDVLLQSDENINDQNHKFFAEAVECETPQGLLNNIKFYTEVNFKEINPKAVIAPNEESVEFANEIAKQYGNIPVILKNEK